MNWINKNKQYALFLTADEYGDLLIKKHNLAVLIRRIVLAIVLISLIIVICLKFMGVF
jgi:hypothetical protein